MEEQGLAGGTIRELSAEDAAPVLAAYLRNREHLAPYEPDRGEEYLTSRVSGPRSPSGWTASGPGRRRPAHPRGRRRGPGQPEHDRARHLPERERRLLGRPRPRRAGAGHGGGRVRAAPPSTSACTGPGTYPDNVGSQTVLLRNGFTLIGPAPAYLFIGAWRDHLLYQRVLHDRPPVG